MSDERDFSCPLGGHRISVEFITGHWARSGEMGSWSRETKTITIDADLDSDDTNETFVHEAVHAVSDFSGLNLDEPVVVALGLGLYQMLSARVLVDEEPAQDAVGN